MGREQGSHRAPSRRGSSLLVLGSLRGPGGCPQEEKPTAGRVLLHFDTDPQPSAFDALVAYDAGIERVLHYGGVRPSQVRGLVQGATFARSGMGSDQTAIFVGGSDLRLAEEILAAVQAAFPHGRRLSVMLDAGGCNTTAAAAVVRLSAAGDLTGQRVVVLAGTGPVGQRSAGLLARLGADVTLSSRRQAAAEAACAAIQAGFGARASPSEVATTDALVRVLDGAYAVLAAGPPGIQLLPERIWRQQPGLGILADLNAVPPLGIEGMQVTWNGEERGGRLFFGAVGIGRLKMELHRTCLSRLFTRNDLILDAEEILGLASEVERCVS